MGISKGDRAGFVQLLDLGKVALIQLRASERPNKSSRDTSFTKPPRGMDREGHDPRFC